MPVFLLSRHMVEGVRDSLGLFYKRTNPICEGPPAGPNRLPNVPPLDIITLELLCNIYISRDTNIPSSAVMKNEFYSDLFRIRYCIQ